MASETDALQPKVVDNGNRHQRLSWKDMAKYKNQIFATAIVTIGSFGTGTVFGWSALATDDIFRRHEFGDITKENEISWVTSLAIFGAFLAGPAAGYAMDSVGRKKSIIIFSFPFVLGWMIMCSAYFVRPHGFFLLYIGRLLTGFCAGAYLVTVPTYVKEIAVDSLRGILGSAVPLMLVSGILYTFLIGTFCHWAWLTALCGIVPIIFSIGTFFIPETPKFLVMKNDMPKALDSYKWLRGIKCDDIGDTRSGLVSAGDYMMSTETTVQKRSWRKLLSRPVALPIVIMVIIMFFQQFGGVNAVTLYTVEIFSSAGDFVDPRTATIILGIFQVVFVLASMALIDVVGRKTLLCSCSLIMGLCLTGLGIYFYLKERKDGSEKGILWLPVATTWTYIGAYSCGVGSVPWVLANELYHPDYRAQSATIMASSYWIFGFIVAQTYGSIKMWLNDSGSFWLYGGFCIGGAIFAALFVPETKGKSSEEILKHFGGDLPTPSLRFDHGTFMGDGDTIISNLTPSVENRTFNSQSDSMANEFSNNKIDHV